MTEAIVSAICNLVAALLFTSLSIKCQDFTIVRIGFGFAAICFWLATGCWTFKVLST